MKVRIAYVTYHHNGSQRYDRWDFNPPVDEAKIIAAAAKIGRTARVMRRYRAKTVDISVA